MAEDRWKTIITFIQFILGTVVLGVFGTIINHQIQTREIEIKEQELIAKSLDTMLRLKDGDQLKMARFYSTVTRSDDIRARWVDYHKLLQSEIDNKKLQIAKAQEEILELKDAREIDNRSLAIAQLNADITPGAAPVLSKDLPARIYLHIQNKDQRERAARLASKLSKLINNVKVSSKIQLIDNSPSENEVRYFKSTDAVEAKNIAKVLSNNNLTAKAKFVTGWESEQKLSPRHYEIWISSSW